MMTNLFSIFDPSTSMMSLAWAAIPMSLLCLPQIFWKVSPPTLKMLKTMAKLLHKEISTTSKNENIKTKGILLTVFITILLVNVLALYPSIFSASSHVTLTLPLSLLFWSSVMLYGWLKNTKHMLIHLLPQGTPVALMAFMVLIEMTSNLIRPITLCVRLTANLIAGHLLMSLLGSALLKMSQAFFAVTFITPMVLSVLESAVAVIQAYVFMTLVTLYTTETS